MIDSPGCLICAVFPSFFSQQHDIIDGCIKARLQRDDPAAASMNCQLDRAVLHHLLCNRGDSSLANLPVVVLQCNAMRWHGLTDDGTHTDGTFAFWLINP